MGKENAEIIMILIGWRANKGSGRWWRARAVRSFDNVEVVNDGPCWVSVSKR